MASTKQCPSCDKSLPLMQEVCACGYDFTWDECPGCDERIPPDALTCPHCNFNLIDGTPAGTKPKKRKDVDSAVAPPTAAVFRKERILVPALANNRENIDFPEMHFNGDANNDQDVIGWAIRLRNTWEIKQGGYLTNYALGYIADYFLNRKDILAERVIALLGGDDSEIKKKK